MSGVSVGFVVSLSVARDDGASDCVEAKLAESVDATSAGRLRVAVLEDSFVVSG